MWSFLFAALLTGCTTTPEKAATDAPAAKAAKAGKTAPAGAKAKVKADKAQKMAKGDKASKAGAKVKEEADPIGVAGAATGVLSLVPTTAPTPAAGATAPPAGPYTEAKLALTFSDGSVTPLSLGKVAGTCSEKAPTPVGPAGQQVTPIWAVSCKDPAGKAIEIAIAQRADAITVLRSAPSAAGGAPEQKVVKRVRLVPGITVSKKP